MPEVQNIGAADYAQSYQPTLYNNNAYMDEDVNAMPEVYDEAVEQKKSSGIGKGMALLGTLAAIGIGFGCYKWGGKSAAKELDALKNSEAVKNYEGLKSTFDGMKSTFDGMKKAATELEKEADKVVDSTFGGFNYGKDFAQKVKEKFTKPFKEQAEKLEKAAKEAAEDAGEVAEEVAEKSV